MPLERHSLAELITQYFQLGLKHDELLHVLAVYHGIVLSKRSLQRKLQLLRLRRRQPSDIYEAVCFIQEEVAKSGGLCGYRCMYAKCKESNIPVTRDVVAIIMQLVDPEGVQWRQRRRLRRRRYFAKGPNYIWHVDGNDKLKPFGVAIHGCIDGYSRHIIWLQAHVTNNDPKLIAGYFINEVASLWGCPCIVRGDRGTENLDLCNIQKYLRRNHTDSFSSDRSFMYGRSTANQRIEFLWGVLRRQCLQYWMDILGVLQDDGFFSGDPIDKQLVRFCYMNIIQVALNQFRQQWNAHTVRSGRNLACPTGIPRVLFSCPALFDTIDYKQCVDPTDLVTCAEQCIGKDEILPDTDLHELLHLLMNEHHWVMPHDATAATELYMNLRNVLLPLIA